MDDSLKSYQGNLQQNQSILQNNLGKTYFQDSSLGPELFE